MKLKSSTGELVTVPDGMEEAAFQAQSEGRLKEFADGLKERVEAKKGGMLKRKDGSYSRRGLWDNIRANRGSGRKPTKEMLKQEAKIRAKEAAGGVVYEGKVTDWTPGEAVPWHTSTIGEKMGKGGYTVKRSSARKGKTHVVIGPDGTKKYFGDSKLGQHPGNPKRKKSFYARHAKNLKKNPYFRAFARATWDDGGKLTANMYDQGIMPYDFGGPVHMTPSIYGGVPSHSTAYRMAAGGMLPSGLMDIPVGYGTPAYNERYDLGGDIGAGLTGIVGGALGTVPLVGGILQQGVNSLGEKIQGPLSDQEKAIRGFGSAAGGIGAGLATGNIGGAISQGGSGLSQGISAMSPESAAAQGIAQGLNVAGTLGGMAAGMGAFGNAGAGNALKFNEAIKGTRFGNTYGALNKASAFNPLMSFAQNASNIKMADGGQSGLVPINVEGADFSEGSGPDARKGELLVLKGRIYKNYVGRPPHPAEGQDPMGNDDAPEGLIVIPKNRTKEYLEAGLVKRQQIERSLVSQQREREMKKSRQMGDGGYYSFGMGEMGMAFGGPIGNPETIRSMMEWGGPDAYKKGGWIQKVTKSIKRRGTEGVCTGSKFGSSSCPPGSRRYNLAKTFRKMAKARKHEHGGFVDPVTGSHDVMYEMGGNINPYISYGRAVSNKFAEGGQLPESLLRTRMRASGASPEEINQYVAENYGYGGMAMYADGGKLPAGILRARMEASGKSDAAIKNYMNNYYEMGGPVNVDKSLVYEGMQRRAMAKNGMITSMPMRRRYDLTSVVSSTGAMAPFTSDFSGSGVPIDWMSPDARAPLNYASPFTAAQPAAPGIQPTPAQAAMMRRINAGEPITATTYKPTYQIPTVELDLNQRTFTPYMDEGMNAQGEYYNQTTGTAGPNSESNMAKQARIQNINRAAALQDLAGLAPTLYNLGRYAFEKPDLMKYDEYMTPEMKFRATKYDPTLLMYESAAAKRNLMERAPGPGYRSALTNLSAGMGKAQTAGYMDWLRSEALRKQGVDEANLGIDARNKAMKYQIALQNMASKARRKDFLGTATEQFAQTFGRDPRYFAAIAGDKSAYRTPFSGWFDSGANTTTNTTTGSTTSTVSSPMFNAANRRYMAGVDRDLAAQFPNIYKTGR